MGQRGELFSTRIFTDEGRKTFFFNVKENRFHDTYLNIVESRKTDTGFRRSSLVVFSEDLQRFLSVLDECVTDISNRRDCPERNLDVGGGRRSYNFRIPPKGKKALQITERRQDISSVKKQSVIITAPSLESFMMGLGKAVGFLKKNGKSSF